MGVRAILFGAVLDGQVQLNAYGQVAATMWGRLPRHFSQVELDAWVIMPNHIHGIFVIVDAPGKGDAFPDARSEPGDTPSGVSRLNGETSFGECVAPTPGSLGAIVGNFKSVTTRRINRTRKTPGAPVWQRNYYERIIRNQRELDAVRRYIRDNPAQWENDGENPDRR